MSRHEVKLETQPDNVWLVSFEAYLRFFQWLLAHLFCLSIKFTHFYIFCFGFAGNQANAVSEKEAANWKGCHIKSCLQQNEKNVLSCCSLTVSESAPWSVSSVCLCCLGFPSPLWLKTLDNDIYEEDSSKSPLSFDFVLSMPFILFLSNIRVQMT